MNDICTQSALSLVKVISLLTKGIVNLVIIILDRVWEMYFLLFSFFSAIRTDARKTRTKINILSSENNDHHCAINKFFTLIYVYFIQEYFKSGKDKSRRFSCHV